MNYSNNIPMSCWAEDDKPSTKILLKGKAALSDAELLSIIIGKNGPRERSSLETARSILHLTGYNLGEIAKLSVIDLIQAGNIKVEQATRVISAFEIGRRRSSSTVAAKGKITSSTNASELFKPLLTDKPYEEFWIILMNRANRVLGCKKVSEGGVSGTVVDPKKIFKIALDNLATSIILGHNHPSGNLNPSEADHQITRKLVEAGKLLDISVLDHLIITDDGFYSFADQGSL